MRKIAYEDLVGYPPLVWRAGGNDPARGVDCWWMHRELQARAGRAVPGWDQASMVSTSQMRRYLIGLGADVWEEIPIVDPPVALLDAWIEEDGNQPHVYTVVDEERRLLVSIGQDCGAHVVRADRLRPTRILRLRRFAPCLR